MSHVSRSFAPLLLLVTAACSSTGVALCNRLDECNALGAGVSASQCAESIDLGLQNMTESLRSDCQGLIADALDNESCEVFLSELPGCP